MEVDVPVIAWHYELLGQKGEVTSFMLVED